MTDETSKRSSDPQPLHFDNDTGAGRATWIAGVITLAIVLWMGSGFIFPPENGASTVGRTDPQPVSVAVRTSTAESVTQYFQAEGQALPDRDSPLRAETSGDIAEVMVSKGEDVDRGAVIATFDIMRVEADLRRADEELARAQREFDNAQTLLERGVSTADRVAAARAALASAEAQRTAAEEAIENAAILAPFAGRIETLDIDPGEFIQAGSEIGRIVDNRPLTVAIQVPQQSLTQLETGQPAQVLFITGEEREGTVTFVGTSAASETRTFLTEIEVPNDDGAIPAGISAEVRIPVGETKAHFLSASIVSLNEDGALGVKTVDDDQTVVFHPIEVTTAQIDGIWVTGLPDTTEIITVGQGFVRDGEVVNARPEEAGQ